jgi:hypothetical protein
MELNLAVQKVPEQSSTGIVERDTGLITGAFDTENNHLGRD